MIHREFTKHTEEPSSLRANVAGESVFGTTDAKRAGRTSGLSASASAESLPAKAGNIISGRTASAGEASDCEAPARAAKESRASSSAVTAAATTSHRSTKGKCRAIDPTDAELQRL